jgi:hypothetical protein
MPDFALKHTITAACALAREARSLGKGRVKRNRRHPHYECRWACGSALFSLHPQSEIGEAQQRPMNELLFLDSSLDWRVPAVLEFCQQSFWRFATSPSSSFASDALNPAVLNSAVCNAAGFPREEAAYVFWAETALRA